MRKLFVSAVCLLVTLVLFNNVSAKNKWSVSPVLENRWGNTEYELNILFYDYDLDSNIVTRQLISILDFPLNDVNAGLNIRLIPNDTAKMYWYANLKATMAISNPTDKMTDTDWDKVINYYDSKFSYTESRVESNSFDISIEAGRELFTMGKSKIALMAGIRYQNIKQDIDNFIGWFKPFDSANFQYMDSVPVFGQNETALIYEITYVTPFAGAVMHNKLGANSYVDLKTAMQSVFVKDKDDHLLRFKLSTASGNGIGFLGGVNLGLSFGKAQAKAKPFINLNGEFSYIKIETNQTQSWYGDDPASPDDDTGSMIDRLPHIIRSAQIRAGLQFGITF